MAENDVIVEQFRQLVRGSSDSLLAFLPPFAEAVTVEGTSTLVRTHFLACDENGIPAVESLAGAMASAALDFCIPRYKIEQAFADYEKTRSTEAIVRLHEEALDLFVRSEKSGEGGELLLFLLLERVLQRPQLLSKMALKTNSQVHVHGTDGIHANLEDDGVLELYWGESKLYQSSSEAFRDCIESIAPYLRPDGRESRKRDLLLVRDHLNVTQTELVSYLLEYFDEAKPKSLRVRWSGVCLVGFDHEHYPNIASLDEDEKKLLLRVLERWRQTVKKQVSRFEIVDVKIDLFCIPMPCVDDLRACVLKRMRVK